MNNEKYVINMDLPCKHRSISKYCQKEGDLEIAVGEALKFAVTSSCKPYEYIDEDGKISRTIAVTYGGGKIQRVSLDEKGKLTEIYLSNEWVVEVDKGLAYNNNPAENNHPRRKLIRLEKVASN